MLKRILLAIAALFAAPLMSVLASTPPARAEGHLVLTVYPSIVANYAKYPVSVQLQDDSGRPVFPSQPITVQLSSSNPGIVEILEGPHVGYARKQVTLAPPNPAKSILGNTFDVFEVRAAHRDVQGTSTITASAPGYGQASAQISTFAGANPMPPAQKVSITLFPPIVAADEKPTFLIQPYDANGHQTFHRNAEIAYKMSSSNPNVMPFSDVADNTGHSGGQVFGEFGRARSPGQTQISFLPQGTPVLGSSATLTVVPRPATVGPGNTVVPPPPFPPSPPDTTPSGRTTVDLGKDVVIQPGATWEGDIPASAILDLQARIQYPKAVGSNISLNISVNGRQITTPLLNKAPQHTMRDGRIFPYFDPATASWLLFLSPDFVQNNIPASGGYQAITDLGEAYHYRWNTGITGGGPTMHIRIVHTGLRHLGPIIVRFSDGQVATTTNVPDELVIQPGMAWEGDVPTARVLDLQARLNYAHTAGSNFALDISVNGHRVESPLLNKAAQYKYQDGRTYPYYDPAKGGWMAFYSPDFAANNSATGGGYRVLTNPGEAYHYRWDVSTFSGNGPTMHVRLSHRDPAAVGPLVIRLGR